MKTTKLIDVADIIYGYAFNSKLFNTSGEGRPLIRIRDVNTGFSNTYTTENAPEKYLVRNGDFLIGMDGNFEIVKWANGEALLNQRFVVHSRYFLWLNFTFVSSTIAYSKVVSILECPKRC